MDIKSDTVRRVMCLIEEGKFFHLI